MTALATIETMKKNTLSRTFCGELSAYDLSDELTANLLERMMMGNTE